MQALTKQRTPSRRCSAPEMTDPTTLTDLELLRHWQQKALVCVCRDGVARSDRRGTRDGSPYTCGSDGYPPTDWCGPQRQAVRALREIERRNIQLPIGWRMAISEDNSCGRRKLGGDYSEFDDIMNEHITKMEAAGA